MIHTLNVLIDEARGNGIKYFEDLPVIIQDRMLELFSRSGIVDTADMISAIDVNGIVADSFAEKWGTSTWSPSDRLMRNIKNAYRSRAIKYISKALED